MIMKALTLTLLLFVLGGMSFDATAQIYTYTDENGVTVFTDRKPDGNRYNVHNLGCYGTCRKGVDWQRTPLKTGVFDAEIRAASEIFGIDDALVAAHRNGIKIRGCLDRLQANQKWAAKDVLTEAGIDIRPPVEPAQEAQ